jgi:predicted membrane-bound spermidine synthase
MSVMEKPGLQRTLFALFAISGFSGLIYESIWTHYLKLFLGHAAYAQTLVLAIFMGGMALGAWLASRWMTRLKSPLMGYVLVELGIGVAGLLFHRVFTNSSAWMLDSLFPVLGNDLAIETVRWAYAALLILPQSLLLGATFPLMSGGILRHYPALPGGTIARLYFSNSIGAVAGVLVSGFWLIRTVGLPGTILTAALANFFLAAAVYFCVKRLNPAPAVASASRGLGPSEKLLLIVALVTGLSSFIYEVSWIRMLSLVLGASTHAFELMLAAFILGLALGGLWVRRRIDRFANPLRALAIVQIAMGALALGTIVGYNHMFDVMRFVMRALQYNDEGYLLFNVSSHLIAMIVMLPVTLMAGMTLPLITYVLFREGSGERAIGWVYASNTLGAIVGVALSMQVLLPLLGLKAAITLGAGLDLLLGVWLLLRAGEKQERAAMALVGCVALMLAVSLTARFDLHKMASGVFRHGQLQRGETLFHRDGRTATIDVVGYPNGVMSIITNGKPDASLMMRPGAAPTDDEPTMILAGGLPLLYMPQAQDAAVIGMGSGLTASMLLKSPTLKHMDVVEIEAAMVEGAQYFGERVRPVYEDPRSHIHINDAKSYFAANQRRYDLIVSEPSNPWVSGVSNVFSAEFYQRIRQHLRDDGVLVQWFQLYEMSPDLVHSILKALTPHFSDYEIYASNSSDVVLVAKKNGKLGTLRETLLQVPGFRAEFERMQWFSVADVAAHRLIDKEAFGALLDFSGAPANSDYFPFVDQHAVAARFKREQAKHLYEMTNIAIPMPGPHFLQPPRVTDQARPIAFMPRQQAIFAQRIAHRFATSTGSAPGLPDDLAILLERTLAPRDCRSVMQQRIWRSDMVQLMATVLPRVSGADTEPMLAYYEARRCPGGNDADWLALFRAIAVRDMPHQAALAERLLATDVDAAARSYLTQTALVASFQLGRYERVVQLAGTGALPVSVDLIAVQAGQRMTKAEVSGRH